MNIPGLQRKCIFRVASANVAVREFASIEEKLKIPPRPKKPLTPFFRFLALNREKALSQNKDLKAMGVVQVVSKEWANVDQQLKAKLTDEYMKEKEDYTKIIAQYETKLTDEQKDGIRVAKQERVEGKEKRAHRKVSQVTICNVAFEINKILFIESPREQQTEEAGVGLSPIFDRRICYG